MTRTALASHTALVYGGPDQFAGAVGAYLCEGVARDERVMAVVPQVKLERLRDELGTDAQHVEFVDARDGYRPQWNVFRAVLDSLAQAPGRQLRVVAEQDLAVRSPAWWRPTRPTDITARWSRCPVPMKRCRTRTRTSPSRRAPTAAGSRS